MIILKKKKNTQEHKKENNRLTRQKHKRHTDDKIESLRSHTKKIVYVGKDCWALWMVSIINKL